MNDGTPHLPDLRERNMQKRQERILLEARRMIAEQGYDALSTRALAKSAGVTQPTLYNLIGSKDEIVRALLIETAERIEGIIHAIDVDDLIANIDAFMETIVDVFTEDPSYYRAALIAADRNIDLFAEDGPTERPRSIAAIAISIIKQTCEIQIANGNLRGAVGAADLSSALYASFKVHLRDWGHGAISLETFTRRVLCAHYLLFAADAKPALRRRLLEKYQRLESL